MEISSKFGDFWIKRWKSFCAFVWSAKAGGREGQGSKTLAVKICYVGLKRYANVSPNNEIGMLI